MTTRPIIMSAESVKAILDGRKTQTRRVVKPQPKDDPSSVRPFVVDGPSPSGAGVCGHTLRLDECPYGVPGDRLWVREPWQAWSSLTLEIEEVRVERVQEITNPDVIAEGYAVPAHSGAMYSPALAQECDDNAVEWFAEHWDSINAKPGFSWESNPWVWAIEFKPVESAERSEA